MNLFYAQKSPDETSGIYLNLDALEQAQDSIKVFKAQFQKFDTWRRVPSHTIFGVFPLGHIDNLPHEDFQNLKNLDAKLSHEDELLQFVRITLRFNHLHAAQKSHYEWVKYLEHPRVLVSRVNDVIFMTVMLPIRGFQDRCMVEQSIVEINSPKAKSSCFELIKKAGLRYFNNTVDNFNGLRLDLSEASHMEQFCDAILVDSHSYKEGKRVATVKMRELNDAIKALEAQKQQVAEEFGTQTRKLLEDKLEYMTQDSSYNQEMVSNIKAKTNSSNCVRWNFLGEGRAGGRW